MINIWNPPPIVSAWVMMRPNGVVASWLERKREEGRISGLRSSIKGMNQSSLSAYKGSFAGASRITDGWP